MNDSTGNSVVAAYVGAVRDELADLSVSDRADLMEDVSEHVAAVAAEYDDPTMDALVDRLGAPASFAAELRESAGLVPVAADEVIADGYFRRLGRFMAVVLAVAAVAMVPAAVLVYDTGLLWAAGIVAAAAGGMFALLVRDGREWMGELGQMPGASLLRRARVWFTEQTWSSEAVDFSVSLRPAWWILRAVALAIAIGMVMVSVPVIFIAVLPLVAVSVWLGRRTVERRPQRTARGLAVAANGALALTAIGAAMGMFEQVTEPPVYMASDPYQEVYVDAGSVGDGMVYRADGTLVTNLFPYGPDGQLLEGVWLYDQDGRPFELGLAENCEEWAEPGWLYLPHGDPKNAFPHRLSEADPATGECLDPVMEPPFGPFLPGSPVTEPTPEPSSPAVAPQATPEPPSSAPDANGSPGS